MANLVARILLFSDSHRGVESKLYEERWFPPFCNFFERIKGKLFLPEDLTEKFLALFDNMTQDSFSKMLYEAEKSKPYDLILGLGNYTPGANESGMLTPKSRHQFFQFLSLLNSAFSAKKILIWGCHDAGYRFKVGRTIGTERGELSVGSFKVAEQLVGPPFGTFDIGPARFIYISTNLVRNVYPDSPDELKEARKNQEMFLFEQMKRCDRKPLFLLLHDPTALPLETDIIKYLYSFREKITAIIHGHMHAEFSARITRIFYSFYRKLCRDFRVICVPAPWGMFGIGKRFMTMNLYDDGKYEIKRHKL